MSNKLIRGLELTHLVAWIANIGFVQLYVVPSVLVATTTISAWINGVPIWALVLLGALTFVFATWGVLGFVLLRSLLSIEDKLSVTDYPVFGKIDVLTSTVSIEELQLGIEVRNHASFTLEHKFDSIETEFDGRICTGEKSELKSARIPPDGKLIFRDKMIVLSPPIIVAVTPGQLIRKMGTIKYKSWYSRKGGTRYQLHGLITMHAAISSKGVEWTWMNKSE